MALSSDYSFSNLPIWASKHGIVFDAEGQTGSAITQRLTEGCVKKRRMFRCVARLDLSRRITPDGRTCLQICDGNFDRWANSVGAEVTLPQSQVQFDEAIDLLLWWSKIRRQPYMWWLNLEPDLDIARQLVELPHVVQPDRVHWKDDRSYEVNDEAREFLGTLTGRTYVHAGFVLFERPVDATMFKLAYG